MISECHAPGIQISTNQCTRFKQSIVCVILSAIANMSEIATENAGRLRDKLNVHQESGIKIIKNTSIPHNLKKNRVFNALA